MAAAFPWQKDLQFLSVQLTSSSPCWWIAKTPNRPGTYLRGTTTVLFPPALNSPLCTPRVWPPLGPPCPTQPAEETDCRVRECPPPGLAPPSPVCMEGGRQHSPRLFFLLFFSPLRRRGSFPFPLLVRSEWRLLFGARHPTAPHGTAPPAQALRLRLCCCLTCFLLPRLLSWSGSLGCSSLPPGGKGGAQARTYGTLTHTHTHTPDCMACHGSSSSGGEEALSLS